MDIINFSQVYYKIGKLIGYAYTLKNRQVGEELRAKLQDLELAVDNVLKGGKNE